MEAEKPRLGRPVASRVSYRLPVKQISPDKRMNFPCTAASFTVAVRPHGFDVLCHLAFSLRLIDALVHLPVRYTQTGQLAVLRPASFRPPLTGWPSIPQFINESEEGVRESSVSRFSESVHE